MNDDFSFAWDGAAPSPSSPTSRTTWRLLGGRTLTLERRGGSDVASIAHDGSRLVTIEIDERGVRVQARAADLAIDASESIRLAAEDISIEARNALSARSGGDMELTARGHRTSRIGGHERVEAAAVEVQSNDAHIDLRASGHVRVDGEHIGLNDDPCPKAFTWSSRELAKRREAEVEPSERVEPSEGEVDHG